MKALPSKLCVNYVLNYEFFLNNIKTYFKHSKIIIIALVVQTTL